MHFFHPYSFPAPYSYSTMIPSSLPPHALSSYNGSRRLPPIHPQYPLLFNPPPQPFCLGGRDRRRGPQDPGQQYHHYYSPWPWHMWSNNLLNYQHLYSHPQAPPAPVAPTPPKPSRFQTQTWPEGFTLRGDLRWGRLERVYGPRRELPEFVREDLRRVYGTYPRTDLSITYQGGEYVVRGDPHVGEQEYRVERRVVQLAESPEGDSVSEVVEERKKKRGWKGRRS
ncbi:uncharacterized protein LOC134022005 [Osmerus eperlanus]|uniref:uncharacterized protein LOC134022005 n=1 Tax=Osmerus eperlanus TaxID=29151 RepID=UPI002E10EF11